MPIKGKGKRERSNDTSRIIKKRKKWRKRLTEKATDPFLQVLQSVQVIQVVLVILQVQVVPVILSLLDKEQNKLDLINSLPAYVY